MKILLHNFAYLSSKMLSFLFILPKYALNIVTLTSEFSTGN